MTESIVETRPELVRRAAEWLELEMTRAIAERGSCAMGLAGGRTPEPVYHELTSATRIDWKKVHVFFSDERAVPPDGAESNYRMIHLALLSRVPLPPGQVYRMEAERPDREVAAREYERLLPPRLDILLLGMGPDGHTASLFPGGAAVEEKRRLVLPVVGAKPPAKRLTITPPVIEAARSVAVIATGEDKAPMVARALEGPLDPVAVPVQLARRGVWFLDHAAAAKLTVQRVVR